MLPPVNPKLMQTFIINKIFGSYRERKFTTALPLCIHWLPTTGASELLQASSQAGHWSTFSSLHGELTVAKLKIRNTVFRVLRLCFRLAVVVILLLTLRYADGAIRRSRTMLDT